MARTPASEQPETFDQIAEDLQRLREDAGPVSYAEIVRRISEARLARGIHEAAAAPPRSTVYNAFSQGRSRLDTELVRDIVLALGSTEAEADVWVRRCRRAHRGPTPAPSAPSAPVPAPAVFDPPRAFFSEKIDTAPTPVVDPPVRLSSGLVALILVLCVFTNIAGNALIRGLTLPLYLDMVGVAVAATALGPWYGVFVAIATNLAGVAYRDEHDFWFVLVGITGALLWGYGVRRFRMGETFGRFLALGIIVAVACSSVASPLLVIRHAGSFGAGQANVTGALLSAGVPLVLAVFTVNIITSLIDKLLTSYIALASLPILHRWFGVPVGHIPLVKQLQSPPRKSPPHQSPAANTPPRS